MDEGNEAKGRAGKKRQVKKASLKASLNRLSEGVKEVNENC